MQRKKFLKNSILLLGSSSLILNACKKTTTSDGGTTGNCLAAPNETEGPYPYVGGEITNPLQRADITAGQTGLPLSLNFVIVNSNNNCAAVNGARVDIWHCNKDGYYSGYGNQVGGALGGTQSYVGQTWLRGFQLADTAGKAQFITIYPGWYQGRATHIHIEVFVNGVLKKATQITFAETVSDAVHVTPLYSAHGINSMRTASDGIFNNSATDMANETVALTGNTTAGYTGTYQVGVAL